MSALGSGFVYDVKFTPNGVNKVILNEANTKTLETKNRVSKSTDATNWTTVSDIANGTWFEIGLSNAATTGDKKAFAIFLPFTSNVYQAGFLKEISDLTTVSNNTAAGSKVWYCVDMDNWSGGNKYVLAGDAFGLYRSSDGGVTWFSL